MYIAYLFAPGRRELLLTDVAQSETQAQQNRKDKKARLQRWIAGLTRKQDNVMRQAEDADPTDPFTKGLRDRYNELENERRVMLDDIDRLDHEAAAEPRRVDQADVDLVESLPHLTINLHRAPQELQRRLFELTQLTVHVHYETSEVTIVITLPRHGIQLVASAASALSEESGPDMGLQVPAKPQVEGGVNAVRAPMRWLRKPRRRRSACW